MFCVGCFEMTTAEWAPVHASTDASDNPVNAIVRWKLIPALHASGDEIYHIDGRPATKKKRGAASKTMPLVPADQMMFGYFGGLALR
jgi:hypothetical protein